MKSISCHELAVQSNNPAHLIPDFSIVIIPKMNLIPTYNYTSNYKHKIMIIQMIPYFWYGYIANTKGLLIIYRKNKKKKLSTKQ